SAALHATKRSTRSLSPRLFSPGLSIAPVAGERSGPPCSCTLWNPSGRGRPVRSYAIWTKLQLYNACELWVSEASVSSTTRKAPQRLCCCCGQLFHPQPIVSVGLTSAVVEDQGGPLWCR